MIEFDETDTADGPSEQGPADEFVIRGRKISGDPETVSGREKRTPATAAEFTEATDAVLSVPGVHAVRWRQYTPYFNDGEPCEFSVNELEVRFSPLDDEEDERGDYEDGFVDSYSFNYLRKDGELSELSDEHFAALTKATTEWQRLYADEVCRRNFGDHSTVTATLEGFDVEFYDHE
jgi:hypothetical protein